MTLTSEQAKAMNARPRIGPVEEARMIALFAEGKKPAEVAPLFPDSPQNHPNPVKHTSGSPSEQAKAMNARPRIGPCCL
jgi:hypothetical protein